MHRHRWCRQCNSRRSPRKPALTQPRGRRNRYSVSAKINRPHQNCRRPPKVCRSRQRPRKYGHRQRQIVWNHFGRHRPNYDHSRQLHHRCGLYRLANRLTRKMDAPAAHCLSTVPTAVRRRRRTKNPNGTENCYRQTAVPLINCQPIQIAAWAPRKARRRNRGIGNDSEAKIVIWLKKYDVDGRWKWASNEQLCVTSLQNNSLREVKPIFYLVFMMSRTLSNVLQHCKSCDYASSSEWVKV